MICSEQERRERADAHAQRVFVRGEFLCSFIHMRETRREERERIGAIKKDVMSEKQSF